MGGLPFIEPPDQRQIRDGYQLLDEFGAIDADGRLPLSRRLALPIDPRMGGWSSPPAAGLDHVLLIAAALSVQDPRERPVRAERQEADELHRTVRRSRAATC